MVVTWVRWSSGYGGHLSPLRLVLDGPEFYSTLHVSTPSSALQPPP